MGLESSCVRRRTFELARSTAVLALKATYSFMWEGSLHEGGNRNDEKGNVRLHFGCGSVSIRNYCFCNGVNPSSDAIINYIIYSEYFVSLWIVVCWGILIFCRLLSMGERRTTTRRPAPSEIWKLTVSHEDTSDSLKRGPRKTLPPPHNI
jgi:hypothetical protein